MIAKLSKRERYGMEVTAERIFTASIRDQGNEHFVRNTASVPVDPSVLKPVFRTENILDEKRFLESFHHVLPFSGPGRFGLCLPDASVKVFIKEFTELPRKAEDIRQMLFWSVSEFLRVPSDQVRIGWVYSGLNGDGRHVFVIAVAMEIVPAQYESVLKQAGIKVLLVAPSGFSRFNCYAGCIPQTGVRVYLGLFDDCLHAFVFNAGIPMFYKAVRRGAIGDSQASALEDVDLLLQHIHAECSDLDIDSFFIASPVKSAARLKEVLPPLTDTEFTIMDESELVRIDESIQADPPSGPLSYYAGALGTAQTV